MGDGLGARRAHGHSTFRVGEWTVETASGEIRNANTSLRLEPRYMDVLLYLAQSGGEVVRKEEILAAVWADSFVGDKALVRCIAGLRKAFGDDPRHPRYIETLPRRGYRLVARVGPAPTVEKDPVRPFPPHLEAPPKDEPPRDEPAEKRSSEEGADRQPPSARRRPGSRPRLLAALAVALVLAVAGAISLRLSSRTPVATLPPPGTAVKGPDFAVVAVFQNNTGRPRLDSLSTLFRVGLEQSRMIGVIPETQVRASLGRMERAPEAPIDRAVGIELCRREGARFLVRGESGAIGGVVTLTAEVVDPTTDQSVFTGEARAESEADIVPKLDWLVSRVRDALGESVELLVGSPTPLEKVTTSDLAALEAYSLGRRAWGRGRYAEATAHYRSALEIDPGFAMARIALGIGLLSGEIPEGQIELRRALESPERLPLFEQIYGKAWLATTQLDYPEMTRLWTLMTALFPDNAVSHFNLGMLRGLYGGEAEFAADTMRRAAMRLGAAFNLRPALVELRLGRIDEALALVETQSDPPSRGLTGYAVLIQMAAGRHREAAELLGRPDAWHGEDRAWGWFFYYLDRGRLRDAIAALEAGEPPRVRSYTQMHFETARALAYLRAGDPTAAPIREAADLLVEHAGEITALGNSTVPAIVTLGTLAARTGELASGEDLLSTARALTEGKQLPTHLALTDILAAEMLAARGRHAEAINLYRSSLEKAEVLQAYEGLARSLRALGDKETAAGFFETVVDRRAQALGECFELRYYCAGLEANIMRWNDARLALATLYEDLGRTREAEQQYRRFVEHWRNGDEDLPALRAARRRLDALTDAF